MKTYFDYYPGDIAKHFLVGNVAAEVVPCGCQCFMLFCLCFLLRLTLKFGRYQDDFHMITYLYTQFFVLYDIIIILYLTITPLSHQLAIYFRHILY